MVAFDRESPSLNTQPSFTIWPPRVLAANLLVYSAQCDSPNARARAAQPHGFVLT